MASNIVEIEVAEKYKEEVFGVRFQYVPHDKSSEFPITAKIVRELVYKILQQDINKYDAIYRLYPDGKDWIAELCVDEDKIALLKKRCLRDSNRNMFYITPHNERRVEVTVLDWPSQFTSQLRCDLLSKYGQVLKDSFIAHDSEVNVHSRKYTVSLSSTDSHVKEIPFAFRLDGHLVPLLVKGRPPLCFKCDQVGHTRSSCPTNKKKVQKNKPVPIESKKQEEAPQQPRRKRQRNKTSSPRSIPVSKTALLVDKAMELKYIGGVFGGNVKPTDFLCLVLKMLQIQPEKDIVVEFIKNEDFKYVRVLGATYMRLTGTSLDCYKYLEPLYLDYRKLKRMNRNGEFEVLHMDEFIDELLREERVIDVILPRLQKRAVLEEGNELEVRVSPLEEDLEDMDTSEDEDVPRSPSPERTRSKYHDVDKPNRSPSPKFKRSRSRSPHRRDRHKHRSRSREKDRNRDKRHRSPGRRHKDDDDRHRRSKKSKRDRHHRDHDEDRHKDRGDRSRDKRDKDRGRHKDREHKGSKSEIQEANELRAKLGLAPLK